MADLHERLTEMAADARWPPTPDIAPGVRAAIASGAADRARSGRSRRPLLAALLALVVGGALAAPGVGSELLERLGLKGATVTQVRELAPAQLGGPLALGRRYALADARRLVDYELVVPAVLGPPREVYVDGDAVAFVYRAVRSHPPRPLLFIQVPGNTRRYIQKFVAQRARRVRIGGGPGLLLRGPHVVVFDRPGGGTAAEDSRLAKNTLLWERGPLLLRLEAEQPPAELLRLARSVG